MYFLGMTREQPWIFKPLRTLINNNSFKSFCGKLYSHSLDVPLILLRTICQLFYNGLQGQQHLNFQWWQNIFPLKVGLALEKKKRIPLEWGLMKKETHKIISDQWREDCVVNGNSVLFFFLELSFIWSKMNTAAWETVFQIALKNCSWEFLYGL